MRYLLTATLMLASSTVWAVSPAMLGAWRMTGQDCSDGKTISQLSDDSKFVYTFNEGGDLVISINDQSPTGPTSGCHAQAEAKYSVDSGGFMKIESIERVESNCAQVSMSSMEKEVAKPSVQGTALQVSEDGQRLTLAVAKALPHGPCTKGQTVMNVFKRLSDPVTR